jgi:hypothetical protein
MPKTSKTTETEFIKPIAMRTIIVSVVGTTPLIMHRFAKKAWQELLYPSGGKNRAERAETMKHNPLEEYQECFYRNRDPKAPALFHIPNGSFHGAIAAAALDIPGAAKAKLERLTKVGLQIDLYGKPSLFMAMVRNSDMNHTPDVRTRPAFKRWACTLSISYMMNPLTDNQILNLLSAAGEIVGVGDWRPQKGGDYGCFRVVDQNDKELKEIIATEGRKVQQKAFDTPETFDADSADLLSWFNAEVLRRRQDSNGGAKVKARPAIVNGRTAPAEAFDEAMS